MPRAAPCLALAALVPAAALATEPCGDLGECKALVEINASDGDIGFHFLLDGSGLVAAGIDGPDGRPVFRDQAFGPLRRQTMTETFVESAEPLCWADPEAEPDEPIVLLGQFLARWPAGTYTFLGRPEGLGGFGFPDSGTTELTWLLPAAPDEVDFDGATISWEPGDDLGECASKFRLQLLVANGVLPAHPEDVEVDLWEVVMETDVEPGEPGAGEKFTLRLAGDADPLEVTVPPEWLAGLPEDTPLKVEVGAIGGEDNATFTEEDGFCGNETEGCE